MLNMKRQDLIELYQLLTLYRQTYSADPQEAVEMLSEAVAAKYMELTGNSISEARNPRNAGRKRTNDPKTDEKILRLSAEGLSIRSIAAKTGCSYSYVQTFLKNR